MRGKRKKILAYLNFGLFISAFFLYLPLVGQVKKEIEPNEGVNRLRKSALAKGLRRLFSMVTMIGLSCLWINRARIISESKSVVFRK